MILKQKLYLLKIEKLYKLGLLKGYIVPFDDELYSELNKTIFCNIPVDMDIKYLKPNQAPGRCWDRSLEMFFAMPNSQLVRGSLDYFRIFGDEEDENHGWVERDGYVYDPTWRCRFKKEYYYKMFNVHVTTKITEEEYCNESKENEELFISTRETTRESLRVDGPNRYMLPTSIILLQAISDSDENFKRELNKYLEEIDYNQEQIFKALTQELYEKKLKKEN